MKSFNNGRVRFWGLLVAVCLAALGVSNFRVHAQAGGVPDLVMHYADIVFYNGKVVTVDQKFSVAQAVALRDGKFLAVGTNEQVLPLAGPKTRKIDLKGKMAMPGIVDTHQHPFSEGFMAYLKTVNPTEPEKWKTPADAYQDVAKLVKKAKPGELILVPGNVVGGNPGMFNLLCSTAKLDGLDAVSPNNPVVMVEAVNVWPDAINSKAAAMIRPFVKGDIFRKEGSPCTSIEAREATLAYFYSRIPFESMLEFGRIGSHAISDIGITTAKEHTAPVLMTAVREIWARGELTVRMRMPYPFWPLTGNQSIVPPKDAEKLFMYSGNLSGIGDDMFRLVGIRPSNVGGIMATGGMWTIQKKRQELPGMPDRPFGGATGYYDPIIGDWPVPEGEIFPGETSMIQAIRYGWDVASDHTVGDRSVQEVLRAMEIGLKNRVVHRPGQIIAMGHMPMVTPEQISKIKELGIRTGIGPFHVFHEWSIEGGFIAFGTERVSQMEPFRSYLDAGLKPSLEGDLLGPPFWKAYAAISRKDAKYGRVWGPQQKVTREEALRMMTNYGAYQLGEDAKLGSIEAGKLADIIVLDKDYLTMPEDDIAKIKVLVTVVGGKVVHETEGAM